MRLRFLTRLLIASFVAQAFCAVAVRAQAKSPGDSKRVESLKPSERVDSVKPPERVEGVKADERVERVKATVALLGAGLKSRVRVRLRDGTKLQGFISRVVEGGFEVVSTDGKTFGRGFALGYGDVSEVRAREVTLDWLRAAVKTGAGARLFFEAVRGAGLRPPPQPSRHQ